MFSVLFEFDYLIIKMIFNSVLVIVISFILINSKYKIIKQRTAILAFVCIFAFITFFTGIMAHYKPKNGQIKHFLTHGYCNEIYKLVSSIDNDSRIYVNSELSLIKFYRQDRIESPEWGWKLREWVPKRKLLKNYSDEKLNTFSFKFIDPDSFKKDLRIRNIDHLYFILSTDEKVPFESTLDYDVIKKLDFLKCIKTIELKNTKVFIYKVIT